MLKKIFAALDELGQKHELKVKDVMNDRIISIFPDDDVKEAIVKLKKHAISQMPVIEEQRAVGLVSETIILDAMLTKKGHKIKDIMQDPPPIVNKNTTITAVSSLLRFYPMVLVAESGNLVGLVTRSDLLGKVYKG